MSRLWDMPHITDEAADSCISACGTTEGQDPVEQQVKKAKITVAELLRAQSQHFTGIERHDPMLAITSMAMVALYRKLLAWV